MTGRSTRDPAAWSLPEAVEQLVLVGSKLVTHPPPAHVRSLRRWFVEQMAAKLPDDAPPG
jgi:hypothetical protein